MSWRKGGATCRVINPTMEDLACKKNDLKAAFYFVIVSKRRVDTKTRGAYSIHRFVFGGGEKIIKCGVLN